MTLSTPNPKKSHAGDLGNIATPILGDWDTNIDIVYTILVLGDGERGVFLRSIVFPIKNIKQVNTRRNVFGQKFFKLYSKHVSCVI